MKKRTAIAIGDIVSDYIKTNFPDEMKDKLMTQTVIKAWNSVLGDAICQYTTDYSFVKGVFYVKVTSAVLRNDLFLQRQNLLERLNLNIGETTVRSIIFR